MNIDKLKSTDRMSNANLPSKKRKRDDYSQANSQTIPNDAIHGHRCIAFTFCKCYMQTGLHTNIIIRNSLAIRSRVRIAFS